jgi:hypothetical protein
MNEILIVPDIHGRTFWKPALDYSGEIIFLGDYTDPYQYEGFTDANAYSALSEIVKFKQRNPDRVTLLIGNHELHYYDEEYQSSRFSDKYFNKYHAVLTGMETAGLFQICRQIENYLFIHAGITKGWYDLHVDELQKSGNCLEKQINNLFIQDKEIFYEISHYRGGFHVNGSPLWADARELFSETEHFDSNMIQIVGHTQIKSEEPVIKDNICMLDNRQLHVLRNNKLEKYV